MKSVLLVAATVMAVATASESQRIVGGQFAEEHQFPYQIGLFLDGNFKCGGSIIDAQWVLTASHCVLDFGEKIPPSGFRVHVGSSFLGNGQLHVVADTFAHENYGNFQNDVALIKLQERLQFSEAVKPIELNTVDVPVNSVVTIAGYGRIGAGMDLSEHLKFNTASVESKDVCRRLTGVPSEGLLCLTSPDENGACNGDSGGPAVFNDLLVGVANFAVHGCGTADPDGYADVAHFVDWIKNTITKNNSGVLFEKDQ